MWRTISANVVFGIIKTGIAYPFLLALYASNDQIQIERLIYFEVALAASALLCLGIASRAYKLFTMRDLDALTLICILTAGPLVLIYSWNPTSGATFIAALVALDRGFDLLHQALRQLQRFTQFNWSDLLAQSLTKLAFLLPAYGLEVVWVILIAKLLLLIGLFVRVFGLKELMSILRLPKALFQSRRDLQPYLLYDAVNYSSGHIDLLVITALAPPDVLRSYFFLKKFLRLPLILLNYVLDVVYVHQRKNESNANSAAFWKLWKAFGVITTLSAIGLLALIGLGNYDDVALPMALSYTATAHFQVDLRLLDHIALLRWTQHRRLALRMASVGATLVAIALAWMWNAWPQFLALSPLLAAAAVLPLLPSRLHRNSLTTCLGFILTSVGALIVAYLVGANPAAVSLWFMAAGLITALSIAQSFVVVARYSFLETRAA